MPAPVLQLSDATGIFRKARRINVVGTSGSGKSTFSRELAALLELPCHEMDAHCWLPGWQGRSDGDFHTRIAEVTATDAWLLDGNYTRTHPVKWARFECVAWLDCPLPVTFLRAVRRAIGRAISKTDLWPGTGNRESFRQTFFQWIRLKHPREASALLSELRRNLPAGDLVAEGGFEPPTKGL